MASLGDPSNPAGPLLEKLLDATLQSRASDLHLRVGAPPFARVDGRLVRTSAAPITSEVLEQLIAVTRGESARGLDATSVEYGFDLPGAGRFRAHAFRESGNWALSLRAIPSQVPGFADLRLPPVVKTFAEMNSGLVLITGPTGSGKSTTAASILRAMAESAVRHVLTLEDPIEYRLTGLSSCVTQREIGRDVEDFSGALRAAVREDPDVLFVGEIRDLETFEVVLQAAESGHMVMSTFHTGTALKTIQRLVGWYRPEEQVSVRARLADALRGVLSQRLLPRKGTRGRVLTTEVMINNYAIKECLREPAKLATIPQVLERSNDQGMHTLDQSLSALVRDGLVSPDVALAQSTSPADLRRQLNLAGLVA